MFKIRSIKQRFTLFMLMPAVVLLLTMGFVVFYYARINILNQWSEAVILKLSIAAHEVDMRLGRPKDLLTAYHSITEESYSEENLDFIVEQLRNLEGLAGVELTLDKKQSQMNRRSNRRMGRGGRDSIMRSSNRGRRMWSMSRIVEVTPPHLDIKSGRETVNLIVELHDQANKKIGQIKASIEFNYLIENVVSTDWWQNHQAFLVDKSGLILASTGSPERKYLADENMSGTAVVLERIKNNSSGTILGSGQPPTKVTGFYRLKQAPWTLIVEAPGEEVLAPIIKFRIYFALITIGFVLMIWLVLRLATGQTAARVKAVANAADLLAQGQFSEPIPVNSSDEVGELTQSFNTMMIQLKERVKLKKDLSLAREVQRSLLPKTIPAIKGVDIAGRSIYCDETGGDYYDFLAFDQSKQEIISLVVGDVSGHGIPSALLMATVRGLIRQRAAMGGSIVDIIGDVNRQVVKDVEDSGQFMTAYYGELNLNKKTFSCVSAGHDAAIIYDCNTDSFSEVGGGGPALGLVYPFEYQEHTKPISTGNIILIGTDGIWETKNTQDEFFGKERLRQIIRENKNELAEKIVDAVLVEVNDFRRPLDTEDDVTLMVVKINEFSQ